MIHEFEQSYLNKYWMKQKQQWENYFENKNNDLNIVDSKIYDLVKSHSKIINVDERKSKIASLLINRELVDKNPVISKLVNYIDDWDNYDNQIPENIKDDKAKYRLFLSKVMKDDVIELMKTRDKLSKKRGFISYPHLVLEANEIDKERLISFLHRYLDRNLEKTKRLIKKYDISWDNWFNDLGRISKTNISYNPEDLIEKFLSVLGLEEKVKKIKVFFKEEGYTGFATSLSQDDIRIVVRPINSLNDINNLFHEVGHAVFYSLIEEEGLFRVIPGSIDEAMAIVMEYLGPRLLLSQTNQDKIDELLTLEYTRCAISALYEFELWDNIDRAEELYIKYYSKLGFKIKSPSLWAIDSFRSIDPVYIHSYVIGIELARNLVTYLENRYSNNYKKWGNWLYHNIYKDGRKTSLLDKLKDLDNFI